MPTTAHGMAYPNPLDARNVPADVMKLATTADQHAVWYATDAADRDARFSDVPIGAIVSSGTTGEVWQKAGAGATWRNLYSDTGIVTAGFTPGIDWTIDYAEASILNGITTLQCSVAWNGAANIQGVNDGALSDQIILTAPPKFAPRRKVPATLMAFYFSATVMINEGGTITLTCMQGDKNAYIRVGDSCRFGASYRAAA